MIASPAFAEEAARAEFVFGSASAISNTGQTRVLAKGSTISEGDTVVNKEARVQLRFTDGAFLSLAPYSRFLIKEYTYNGAADGTEKVTMELLEGALRTITGLIGKQKKEAYLMQTTLATLGIRGTEYSISYLDGITGTVSGGAIVVCNAGGCLDVVKGQSYFVRDADTKPVLTEKAVFLPPPQPTDDARSTAHSSDQNEAEDELVSDAASDKDTSTSSGSGGDSKGKHKDKSAKEDAKENGNGNRKNGGNVLSVGVTTETADKTKDKKAKAPKPENGKADLNSADKKQFAGPTLPLSLEKVSGDGDKSQGTNIPGLDKKDVTMMDFGPFTVMEVDSQNKTLETPVDSISNRAAEKPEKGQVNSNDKPSQSPKQASTQSLSLPLSEVGQENALNAAGKVKTIKLDDVIYDIGNGKKAPKIK